MPAAEVQITYNGITFNDFTDREKFFLLDDIPENFSAPNVNENSSAREGAHGAVHGRNYYGKRYMVMTGKIVAPDQSERITMENQLRAAFILPRDDDSVLAGFETLTMVDEGGVTKTAKAKVVTGPNFSKESGEPWYRDFSITLELEKFFFEGSQKNLPISEKINHTSLQIFQTDNEDLEDQSGDTVLDQSGSTIETEGIVTPGELRLALPGFTLVGVPETAFTGQNAGNFASAPLIVVTGPVTNPKIINDTTGREFQVNIELEAGETLEIDTENGLVIKNGVDVSASITNESRWVYLKPGTNTLRIEDDSGFFEDFSAVVYWKDAYV